MTPQLPRLGVVSVTFNAASHLPVFLQCCLSQKHDNFELLIIDNASADATMTILQGRADSRLSMIRNETNVGYAAACNQAIAIFQARGISEILFINNDTEFQPDLFGAMAFSRMTHGVDAVVPRIVLGSNPDLNWYAGGRFLFWKGFQAEMTGENKPINPLDVSPRLTPVAPGCCILFTAQVLQQVGPFDETFFVYFEDTDYCLRMLYAGKSLLYMPNIQLTHNVSSTTGGPLSAFSVRYYNRNQAYILRKHFAAAIVAYQLPLIFLKACLRLALRRDSPRGFAGRLHATLEGMQIPLQVQRKRRYRIPKLRSQIHISRMPS